MSKMFAWHRVQNLDGTRRTVLHPVCDICLASDPCKSAKGISVESVPFIERAYVALVFSLLGVVGTLLIQRIVGGV